MNTNEDSMKSVTNNKYERKETPNFFYQYWNLLGDNPKLKKSLCVDCCNAGHEVMSAIAKLIRINTNLEDLSLNGGSIAVDIALDLGSALRHNTTITKLRLRWMKFEGTAATLFFRALKDNKVIQELYLEGNDLDVHAAGHLATMIRENKTLRVLHIKMNPIGAEGVKYIAEAMQFNRTIQDLCLQQNNLNAHVSEPLGAMLAHGESQSESVSHGPQPHGNPRRDGLVQVHEVQPYSETLHHDRNDR